MAAPRNKKVYDAIREYVVRALELAIRNYEEGDDHFREVEQWQPAEETAFRKEVFEQPDPWPFLYRIEDKLHALPEHAAAMSTLLEDQQFGPQVDALVGSLLGGHRVEANALLDGFVADLMRRGSLDFDADLFGERYAEVEEAFYDDEMRFTLLMPLVGLRVEDVPLSLDTDLELDRMTDEEITTCLETDLLPSPFPAFGGVTFVADRSRFAVRLRFSLRKRVGSEFDDDQPEAVAKLFEEQEMKLESVIQALRLLKPGMVSSAGRVTTSSSWFLRGSRSFGRGTYGPTVWANEYSLPGSDAAALLDLWRRLWSQRVRKHRALALAIRRFSLADDRALPDDKMLDLMIAAEALLLSDAGSEQDRGELSFRLAIRAAFLLGEDEAARREIYTHMRRAYAARSRIAHGGEVDTVKLPDGTGVDLLTFTNATHHKIRRAILAVIDRAPDSGPMVDWDTLILA